MKRDLLRDNPERLERASRIIAEGFEPKPLKWLLHPELGLIRQDDPRHLAWLEKQNR